MKESVVSVCGGRSFAGGKQGCKFGRNKGGVFHNTLSRSGVYAFSRYIYLGGCGVEIFVFQAAYGAAVYSKSEIASQLVHIYEIYAASDLFIGSEQQTYIAVGQAAVFDGLNGRQYLRYAGFVIGTEKSSAVG